MSVFTCKSKHLGSAYNKYVQTLLRRAYPSTPVERVYHRKYRNIEITDGIIDYGDRLICIEVKAGNIQKKYKLSNEFQNLKLGMKPFLLNSGALQIDKRIKEFQQGKLIINEIEPTRIKKYYPVLITCTEFIPLFEILTNEYLRILKNENILQSSNIVPLNIMDISEFEIIMEMVESGSSFIDLIEEKNRNSEEMSYWNYFYTINQEKKRPDILKKELRSLLDDFVRELGFDRY